ncbi:MAG: NUDIX domain-containing protein [Candidatus Thalassarchaeaceae archaeon]|nr:NUDIX domain-containing protein [Candidatus Thalassarchaeaceae archaeon]
MTLRVLLTGFPPFGGHNENVSDKVRCKIESVGIVDIELQTLLLTCDEAGSEHVASLIRDGGRFDAIIHLGLAESRSAISLERCGQNESRFRMADNSGRVAQGMVIEGGPARLATTASVHVLDEEFEHESDIAWSDSAGAFVCNETIYRTLEAIDSVSAKTSDGRALPAIFIHLPPESEVSLERQVDVVRRVVLALASKPRLEVVGALIFDAEGRILACRRPPEDVWGGWWEFPGGKVDAGERPREALVREIAEELQLDVVPERIVASLNHEYDDRHVSLDIWNCGVIDPKLVNPIEHDEVRWLDRGSLDSVKWLPADEPLIREWVESGLPQS